MLMPHYPPGAYGYLFAILGGLSWLAIIAGVILLVIWAVRSMPRTAFVGPTATKVETPEDILARRFAKGEITAEEFTRSRDLLRGSAPQP